MKIAPVSATIPLVLTAALALPALAQYAGGERAPVPDFAAARRQSSPAYAAFFHAMLAAGVYLPPSPFEAWFLSAAHDDDAISVIAAALPGAARAAARVLAA